jgi:hypothetical protein
VQDFSFERLFFFPARPQADGLTPAHSGAPTQLRITLLNDESAASACPALLVGRMQLPKDLENEDS